MSACSTNYKFKVQTFYSIRISVLRDVTKIRKKSVKTIHFAK